MAVLILPSGTGAVSALRAVTATRALAIAGVAVLATLAVGVGVGVGYRLAAVLPQDAASGVTTLDTAGGRVITERVGALQGRLVRLESEAEDLARRIGPMGAGTAAAPAAVTPGAEPAGGPFEPVADPADLVALLERLDTSLERVESVLGAVADGSTARSLARMAMPTRLPIPGASISSGFGNRRDPFNGRWARHAGVDLPAQSGTAITASAGGRVSYSGYRPAYGNTVEIDHGNGLTTRYAHARRLLVRRGELVLPGQAIATVGSTGRSTGPHLHFEVLRHGRQVEPRQYLAASGH
jgi:murein DD-endopeptidase MepM/ murein hydrolase activator NlpD